MSIPKCNTLVPSGAIPCVRKNSGGKKGVMINHVLNSKEVSCGKKFHQNEYDFYNTVFSLTGQENLIALRKFLPEWYSLVCEYNKEVYFVFENLVKSNKAIIMDLKIGHKTADTGGYFKQMRHYALDTIFSLSNKYGIRLEGANFPIQKFNHGVISLPGKKKYSRYGADPFDIFFSFFQAGNVTRHMIKSLINQLDYLINKALIPNLEILKRVKNSKRVDKFSFGLMGTSLLIIAHDNTIRLKLIDFARSTIVTRANQVNRAYKEMEDFIKTLSSLRSIIVSIF